MRNALREAAFSGEHPTGKRTSGYGESSGFTDSEKEATESHRSRAPGERSQRSKGGPPNNNY